MSDSATFDLAMLVLRLTLGLMLASHGCNKAFGAGGLAGTTRWFESLGLRPAWLHARVAAATEICAGLALAAGFLTTLSCAAFIGLMTVAALTDHRGKGFFVFKGGWEYVGIVGVVSACIAAVGPGGWSLDGALGWEIQGWGWAIAGTALGVLSAIALLTVSRHPATIRPATEGS